MLIKYILVVGLIGYLIGTIHPAYLLIKYLKGEDIRKKGSKNSGASNTVMNYGWSMGFVVMIIDVLKAFTYSFVIANKFNNPLLTTVAGIAVVVGHCFPFYMGFKGGKGTAAGIGFMLALNWKLALLGLLVLILVTIITDYIALGAIGMWISNILSLYLSSFSLAVVLLVLAFTILAIFLHRKNIKRIINKEESGLRGVIHKKS